MLEEIIPVQEAGCRNHGAVHGLGVRGAGSRVRDAQFCRPYEVGQQLHIYAGDPPKVSTVINQKIYMIRGNS